MRNDGRHIMAYSSFVVWISYLPSFESDLDNSDKKVEITMLYLRA